MGHGPGAYERINGGPGTAFEEQHGRILEAGATISAEVDRRCAKEAKALRDLDKQHKEWFRQLNAIDSGATQHRYEWMGDQFAQDPDWRARFYESPEVRAVHDSHWKGSAFYSGEVSAEELQAELRVAHGKVVARLDKERMQRDKRAYKTGRSSNVAIDGVVFHMKARALMEDEEASKMESMALSKLEEDWSGGDPWMRRGEVARELAHARREAFFETANEVRDFGGELEFVETGTRERATQEDLKAGDEVVLAQAGEGAGGYWYVPATSAMAESSTETALVKEDESGGLYVMAPDGKKVGIMAGAIRYSGSGDLDKKTRKAALWLPKDWLSSSDAHGSDLRVGWVSKGKRGYYQHGDEIEKSPAGLFTSRSPATAGLEEGESTLVHELVHRAEDTHDGIKGAEWTFMNSRGLQRGEQLKSLHDYLPCYEKHERYMPDDFAQPYSGKVYSQEMNESWEVLSVGITALVTEEPWLGDDEEYRHFVYGCLVTL